MGGKQSVLGNGAFGKSPTLENIRAAYREGESGMAEQLIRISCEEGGAAGLGRVRRTGGRSAGVWRMWAE